MSTISSLAHRKQKHLSVAVIPDGTTSIGDAAFSLCPKLKQVVIPASVEYIGVAAFCCSGMEEVRFMGVPKTVERAVFTGCKCLKTILIPKGTTSVFAQWFEAAILKEVTTVNIEHANLVEQTRTVQLTYNNHNFNWSKGVEVLLSELFCGPITFYGDPSYQFRRKHLFVFIKKSTAASIKAGKRYALPANTTDFVRKYKEKYSNNRPRIFLFVCDDGQHAYFYDEVCFEETGQKQIIVNSIL